MNPKKPLGPNEYEEDGIVYVKDDDKTGWKYFDEGGELGEEDDEPTPESDDFDEDL